MIKKYNEFISESDSFKLDTDYKDYNLQDAINEIGYEYGSSYSDMSKTNNDPDEDFEKFQSELDRAGFTIEKIREENTNEELIKLYGVLDDVNGLIDLYFYKLFEKIGIDKNIVSLGGPGWEDFSVSEEEAFIRYSYGYHKTKYGLLSIESFSSVEDFKKQALSYLSEYIENDLSSIILDKLYDRKFRELTGISTFNFLKISNYSISEEDRLIIFLNEVCDFLNNTPTKDGEKLNDYNEVDVNQIYDVMENSLENLELDIQLVGNDLIIWSEFEDN